MNEHDDAAGPVALDTDVFSWLYQRKGPYVDFADLVVGHPVALPFPVVEEIKVGAIRAGLGPRRMAALDARIGACVVIPGDARVVAAWARLRARFLGRLKNDGINDLWIAACCLVHRLPLVTGNLSDFGRIAGEFADLRIRHPALR